MIKLANKGESGDVAERVFTAASGVNKRQFDRSITIAWVFESKGDVAGGGYASQKNVMDKPDEPTRKGNEGPTFSSKTRGPKK